MNFTELKKKAAKLRIDALTAIHKANSGHTGGSMSVMDLLVSLYYGEVNGQRLMKYDPVNPQWDQRDFVVLSKGHAAPALYAVLADLGFFDSEKLQGYLQPVYILEGQGLTKDKQQLEYTAYIPAVSYDWVLSEEE